MDRQPVVSSNIKSIGYDHISRTLEIEFHDGGIYQYFGVPETVFNGLMGVPSHGSYFHRYIKDKYRWAKIR
jgi:hypothetical protein